MFTNKDIYAHLKHGGRIEELYSALDAEIESAMDKIEAEAEAEEKQKQAEEEKAVAYANAVAAVENYLAIAAPKVDRKVVPMLLDLLSNPRGGFVCGGTINELFNPFSWLFDN